MRMAQSFSARLHALSSKTRLHEFDDRFLLIQERKQPPDLLLVRPPAVLANLERLRMLDLGALVLAVPLYQAVAILLGERLAPPLECRTHVALAEAFEI